MLPFRQRSLTSIQHIRDPPCCHVHGERRPGKVSNPDLPRQLSIQLLAQVVKAQAPGQRQPRSHVPGTPWRLDLDAVGAAAIAQERVSQMCGFHAELLVVLAHGRPVPIFVRRHHSARDCDASSNAVAGAIAVSAASSETLTVCRRRQRALRLLDRCEVCGRAHCQGWGARWT